jgi:hypothetical protein
MVKKCWKVHHFIEEFIKVILHCAEEQDGLATTVKEIEGIGGKTKGSNFVGRHGNGTRVDVPLPNDGRGFTRSHTQHKRLIFGSSKFFEFVVPVLF